MPVYSSRSGSRHRRTKSGLLFKEADLGTTYSAPRHLVVKNVTSSASCTAIHASISISRLYKAGLGKKLDLAAIEEDKDGDDGSKIDSSLLQ